MFKALMTILVILFIAGCTTVPVFPTEPDDTYLCPQVCLHLQVLQCESGKPVDGVTCEQFCVETQQAGHSLDLSCVLTILDCNAINSCTHNRHEQNK
jgi:hypothetical protein